MLHSPVCLLASISLPPQVIMRIACRFTHRMATHWSRLCNAARYSGCQWLAELQSAPLASGDLLMSSCRQQDAIADLQQEIRSAQAPHEHLINHVRALEERIAEQQAALQAARETSGQLARCASGVLCKWCCSL